MSLIHQQNKLKVLNLRLKFEYECSDVTLTQPVLGGADCDGGR